MHLTKLTDYGLRTLIFLAVKQKPASLDELAAAYGISRNHLVKAVGALRKAGFVVTSRGVGGGIVLAEEAANIRLDKVVQVLEPHMAIVECFDNRKNTCPIKGACQLEKLLYKARQAFLAELQATSLADLVLPHKENLKRILIV